jgi:hypothetical protein
VEPVDPAELAVARAVARAAGRAVYAVRLPDGGRRFALQRPTDPSLLGYVVRRDGAVTFGPAARPQPPPGETSVSAEGHIPAEELRIAREQALLAGRTVFACADHTVLFAPPADGSLRYAVRVDGTVVVGPHAHAERPAVVADAAFLARIGAEVRQLQRLRERALELAGLPEVDHVAWARLERLLPAEERPRLRAAVLGRTDGSTAAALLDTVVEQRLTRLRAEAGRHVRPER